MQKLVYKTCCGCRQQTLMSVRETACVFCRERDALDYVVQERQAKRGAQSAEAGQRRLLKAVKGE